MSDSNKQVKQIIKPADPYEQYETASKTPQTKGEPNTPIEQYRSYVHKHMELGVKKFGVKVENQGIHKCNDKTNTMKTTLFSGYCFVKDMKHETRGKVYEFIIPSLYMKGCGDNHTKRVVNEETQRIVDTHATLGKLPIEDK